MENKERKFNLMTRLESLDEDDVKWVRNNVDSDVHNFHARMVAISMIALHFPRKPIAFKEHLGWEKTVYECPRCFKRLDKGDRYCKGCGGRMDWRNF